MNPFEIPHPPTPVYVLVAAGTYDQGVVGVYASEPEARKAAEDIWPTTDGHHGFRIVSRALGKTHPDVFPRQLSWPRPSTDKPRIEVEA